MAPLIDYNSLKSADVEASAPRAMSSRRVVRPSRLEASIEQHAEPSRET